MDDKGHIEEDLQMEDEYGTGTLRRIYRDIRIWMV